VMLRTLSNYADHPNVGGVILIDLGCEKTNLSQVEKYLLKRENSFDKPVAKIGIQEVGGTQAAIQRGLEEVQKMLPQVNQTAREQCSASELVLGVKCGGSDGFSGISANPSLGRAADLLVRSGGTVLITEVPEFCGAEHLLACRAKDVETGRAVYRMVDWYKDYASKFGAVLNNNPSPGNVMGGLLNITIKSLGAIAKAGSTRVEGVVENTAESGAQFDARSGLRSGVNAWSRCRWSDSRSVHNWPWNDDWQCDYSSHQASFKHARVSANVE
jgi:arabinonate dehydratase